MSHPWTRTAEAEFHAAMTQLGIRPNVATRLVMQELRCQNPGLTPVATPANLAEARGAAIRRAALWVADGRPGRLV